jgi:hypothetical protein
MLIRQSAPASAGVFTSEGDMAYQFHEYPAFVGKDGEAKLVQTAEEHAALGDGWKLPEHAPFTPREEGPDYIEYPKWVNGVIVADAEAEAALLASQPDSERAILMQIAAEKGVKVDGRWSDAKLRSAIEAA